MPQSSHSGQITDPYSTGDLVGRYRIRSLIGVGPLQAWYQAYDPLLKREVALCTYVGSTAGKTARSLELLERAAEFTAGMSHPSLVPILDTGANVGLPFFIYEYMSRTLHDELNDKTVLPRAQCVALARHVAGALDVIHRRGFVHRDLSPVDIFLNSFGDAVVGGLNLAHQANQLSLLPAIRPQYAPPEVIRDGLTEESVAQLRVTPAYDVWALGATIYRCLFGTRPYRVRDLRAAFGGELPIPSHLKTFQAETETNLEGILLRCLAQEPSDRYRTCSDVVVALDLLSNERLQPKTRVFVSHASADRERVESLVVAPLERNGVETWYSKIAIQSAAEWERSILEGLETSKWFVLVMTRRAHESDWVKDELFWAIDHRPGRIVPVVLEACEPESFHIRLRRLQMVDFITDPVAGAQELLSTLQP